MRMDPTYLTNLAAFASTLQARAAQGNSDVDVIKSHPDRYEENNPTVSKDFVADVHDMLNSSTASDATWQDYSAALTTYAETVSRMAMSVAGNPVGTAALSHPTTG